MKPRPLAAAITTAVLVLAALANAWTRPGTSTHGSADGSLWVHVVFGLDAREANWSGHLRVSGADVGELLPWGFEREDRLDAEHLRWECITVVRKGRSAASFAEPYRGLFLRLDNVSPRTVVEFDTVQGRFSLDVADLRFDEAELFANGRASAQLVPSPLPVSPPRGQNDFPTLAIASDGSTWIAWIQFDEDELTDHLLVRRRDNSDREPYLVPAGRYVAFPRLLAVKDRLALFWCEWDGAVWKIRESWWDGEHWSPPKTAVDGPGHAVFLDAAEHAGTVWLAWQEIGPDSRIPQIACLRIDPAGSRSRLPVTAGPGGKWEPSIDVDRSGNAWIAYDSYQHGNYDVYLALVTLTDRGLRVVKRIAVTSSPDFEAHADVDARDDRYVWVAFDAAGPNWGKDFSRDSTTRDGRYAEPLHASRRIELRVYDRNKNRLFEPAAALPQLRNPRKPSKVAHSYQEETIRFYELPQFARDAKGRLWVLYRLNRQGYCGHPPMGAAWELCATTFLDNRWIDAVTFPHSRGRQEQKAAIAADRIAWSSGHHHVDLPYSIFMSRLPELEGEQRIPLRPVPLPREADDVVRDLSAPRFREGDRELLFGDLHRHTEISLCTPTVDGSLTETYRYALDVAPLDFLAVTDHTRDTDPYPWWLTQKAADMFYIPGHFVSIYAYERSNAIVNGGHRNVFFRDRNWPVLRSDAYYSATRQKAPDTAPDTSLYPRLRGRFAFTIAHTPGFNVRAGKGTWTYHDPQVEPVAEIFQAYRRDYERPDPPSVPEQASLWYALGRGHRLGFIASSDHHSTHLSFACVWAGARTREGVFRAIQARHTFGAMDQLMLEMRVNGALMGSTVSVEDPAASPVIRIRARGTAPVEEIQLIRSARVVKSLSPGTEDVDVTIVDRDFPGGSCYYYVRLRQVDGTVAWGSPVWVRSGQQHH